MLFLLYTLVYLGHLAPLLGVGLAAFGLLSPAWAAAMLGSKFIVDLALFCAALSEERRGLVRAFLAEEGMLFLHFMTVPFTLLVAPRIRWKGRTH
jgi:hypothetical protein